MVQRQRVFHFPAHYGDRFEISQAQLRDCKDIVTCPSCSLITRIIIGSTTVDGLDDIDQLRVRGSCEHSHEWTIYLLPVVHGQLLDVVDEKGGFDLKRRCLSLFPVQRYTSSCMSRFGAIFQRK